jgi:hypothetical protein
MQSSSSKWVFVAGLLLLTASSVRAARVDMNDPRRALGREDDVRIDAQLLQNEISATSPVSITYQVQNLSSQPIAFADRVRQVDYDPETRTVQFSIGAEVPETDAMPHLTIVRPGEKKTLSTSGTLHVAFPTARTPWTAVPRFVQIRVIILRDLKPFAALAENQALPHDLFDRWVEASDTVFLNPIPVRWKAGPSRGPADTPGIPGLDAGGGGIF